MNGHFLTIKLILRSLFLLSILVVPVQAGGFFTGGVGGGGDSWGSDGGLDDAFATGPEGEEFTAEETNDDNFGFSGVGSDSPGTDSLGATNPFNEGGFGENGPGLGGYGGADTELSEGSVLQDPTAPVHTQNYYDKLNPEVDEEYVHHPAGSTYYDRKNQKKEGNGDGK